LEADVYRVLERFIDEASRLSGVFAELRVERVRFSRISIREGVAEVSSGIDQGIAVRVFYRGAAGFASVSRVSVDDALYALRTAYSMARAMNRGEQPRPVEVGGLRKHYRHPVKRSIDDVSVDEKVRDLERLDSIVSRPRFVKSRSIWYYDAVEQRYYASTEGRLVSEEREVSYLASSIFGLENGVRGSSIMVEGSIEGYTIWDKTGGPEKFGETLVSRLRSQLEAKTPRAGRFPVVLAPEAVGVFVHEAFGHLAEADLVASGSVLQGMKGRRVASPLVTIVDDPTVKDGFGTFMFDDEGVEASRVVIVERGVHREIMTDRLHAAMLGERPTGNARAESYRHPPLVRMRNTFMLPGDARLEEMLEDIDYGYYIVSTSGGETSPNGSFQVGVREAFEIVKGEIGEPVRNLSISGNTLETLLNIDMVGRDFKLFYGRCGKGQVVFVSDGGPHVRVKSMAVGGRV